MIKDLSGRAMRNMVLVCLSSAIVSCMAQPADVKKVSTLNVNALRIASADTAVKAVSASVAAYQEVPVVSVDELANGNARVFSNPHGYSTGNLLVSSTSITARFDMSLGFCGGTWLRQVSGAKVSGVWYVNTHLDHELESVRLCQIGLIINRLADFEKVVLMGDLNAEPDSVPLQRLLSNGYKISLGGGTFPAAHPTKKIDYILTRGVVSSSGSLIGLSNPVSDHLGITTLINGGFSYGKPL